MSGDPDAVVIGSGPNGLAAAVALAQRGVSVLVVEGKDTIGGGTRTEELTLPGFRHDVCSGCHPMGILSPFFRTLPLAEHGLKWVLPQVSVAHPLDGQPSVLLAKSVGETAAGLGADERAYRRFVEPFDADVPSLLEDVLGTLRVPRSPLRMLRFGLRGLRSAVAVARGRFREDRARALFAGCAAHAIIPLDHALTAAVGLTFLLTAHAEPWPVAEGGSSAIAASLATLLKSLGGRIETGRMVHDIDELPPARAFLFDTSPSQLARIAGRRLPQGYKRRLERYRMGPGVFKIDWALDAPIPWRDPRTLEASTVHVGGTVDEIAASERAMWGGEHAEKPFVLVIQQSVFDPTRAPPGKHTGYAYCHVPAGSTLDRTEVVERQIERFAPGFRERILARHAMTTADLERHNPSLHGGAITGGAADLAQLFFRPVARWSPYTTPDPRIFLCSSSTPPGGGVHGMCGVHAARAALRVLAAG